MADIREGLCPLCGHGEIVEAPLQQCVHYKSRDTLAPIAVTWEKDNGFFADTVKALNGIHLYVCRACGFTQLFTEDPKTIPVGEAHQTRLIKHSS